MCQAQQLWPQKMKEVGVRIPINRWRNGGSNVTQLDRDKTRSSARAQERDCTLPPSPPHTSCEVILLGAGSAQAGPWENDSRLK